jgi:hypothetical protein
MIIFATLIMMMIDMSNNKNAAFTNTIAMSTTTTPDSRMRDKLTNLLRVTTEKATTCPAVTTTQ